MKRRWTVFVLAGSAFGLATVGYAVLASGLRPVDPNIVTATEDIMEAVAALTAAAACGWTASRSDGQMRRGWFLMGASAAAWFAGEVIWTVYEVGLGIAVPFPSAADAGFLASMPLAMAGVISFWSAPRGTAARWRVWLDGLIIAVSLTFTGWVLGLQSVYESAGTFAERAISLAYPSGDILVLTILILGVRRATHRQQAQMLLLLAGLAAISIADSSFAYLNATNQYGSLGSLLDLGWVAGFFTISLAAIWPGSVVSQAAERGPIDLWQVVLPWTAVGTVAISGMMLGFSGRPVDVFISVLGGTLATLLIASLVLAERESLALIAKARQSESDLAEVLTQAPVGIAQASTDFKVISANPGLLALFRERRDVMIGSTFVKYIPAESQAEVFGKLGDLMNGSATTVEAESRMLRADGSPIWVHWTSTAVKNPAGETAYFLTMLQDAGSRHAADEAAAASLAVLERLNRLKTEFLQSVSHEFKTALIGIQGFSEYMRDMDELNVDDVRTFATDIYNDAERLARVVDEMLDLDRLETSRSTLHLEPLDLNAIVTSEADELRKEMDGSTITTTLDSQLPVVPGDRAKVSQTVRVLLHNALKYSPDGGSILVSTELAGAQVQVNIKDQGIGVRADFDNPVFDDHDLYASNPIRRVFGTGLGLGVARQIVEMQGGRIWVDRLDGVGSEFHFTLPVGSRLVRANQALADVAKAQVA